MENISGAHVKFKYISKCNFLPIIIKSVTKKSPLSTLNFYIIPFLVKEDNQLHWYFFFEWQHAFNTSKPINATNFTNIFNTSW